MADYAGNYIGDAKSLALTKSRNGSPQVEVSFSIFEIEQDGEFVPMNHPLDRTIYLSLKGKAEPITFEQLDRLGFNGSFTNPELAEPRQELNCYENEYDGKVSMRWRLAGGKPESEAADIDTVKKAEARWRNAHQGKTAPAATTVTSKISKPAPSVPDDSDVPF